MTRWSRAKWAIPAFLGLLTATVVVAVLVARERRSPSRFSAVEQEIAQANPNVPPEIAALNAQLAQIKELHEGVTYGAGLSHVVRGPIPSLRSILGEEWRELGQATGHARLHPNGTRSPYLEIDAVAVARHGPARLVLTTSEGVRSAVPVGTGSFDVVTFGPLPTPSRGPVDVTVKSEAPHGGAAGPALVLSPLQAEYRRPGEWVGGMPALAQAGPGGLRGLYLATGSTTRFAMTPGVKCPCVIELEGAAVPAPVEVTIAIGRELHSTSVSNAPSKLSVGAFSRWAASLTVSVSSPAGSPKSNLFISDMGFAAANPRR
jgi:hypothetical protein